MFIFEGDETHRTAGTGVMSRGDADPADPDPVPGFSRDLAQRDATETPSEVTVKLHRMSTDSCSQQPDLVFEKLLRRQFHEGRSLVDDACEVSGGGLVSGCDQLTMAGSSTPQQSGAGNLEVVECTDQDPLLQFRHPDPCSTHQILGRIEGATGKDRLDAGLA